MEKEVELLDYIVKSLVNNQDAVKIERREDDRGILLLLIVDKEDMGRIIGKNGNIVQAIRTILKLLGIKHDLKINLKVIEPGEEGLMDAPSPVAKSAPEANEEDSEEVAPPDEEEKTEEEKPFEIPELDV